MEKIKIDELFKEQVQELNNKIQKVYENDASSFVKGNFRAEVFNIKALLTKSRNKDQILYIPINSVSMGASGFADFIIGDGVEVEIDNDIAQEKRNEIAENCGFDDVLYNAVLEQSVYGYGNVRVRMQDEQVKIEQIPYKYYFPVLSDIYFGEDPKKIYIVSESQKSKVLFVQKTITAKVQEYENIGEKKRSIKEHLCDKEVDGRKIRETISQEVIEFNNIFRIDNKKLGDRYLGVSDFMDVLDLVEEVNDKITQVSFEFIKHLRSRMSLPEGINSIISREKDEKGNPKHTVNDLDVFVHRQGEQPAQYVENRNMLIAEARLYIMMIVRIMAAVIQCPSSFFGVDEQGSEEKVEALKIKMMRFLKKVQRKQNAVKKAVKGIVETSLLLSKISGDFKIEVKFKDDILVDSQQNFTNYIDLFEKGLLSKKSAMGYLLDRDVESVEKELELITKEKDALISTNDTNGDNIGGGKGDQGNNDQGTV